MLLVGLFMSTSNVMRPVSQPLLPPEKADSGGGGGGGTSFAPQILPAGAPFSVYVEHLSASTTSDMRSTSVPFSSTKPSTTLSSAFFRVSMRIEKWPAPAISPHAPSIARQVAPSQVTPSTVC